MNKFKYIILILLFGCAPYEDIGEFKTVLLEKGDAVVEVSAAMGTHQRFNSTYSFVFIIDGYADSLICQIVILELPDSMLELIEVPVIGETYTEVWSKTSFDVSIIPDLGWSAKLIEI